MTVIGSIDGCTAQTRSPTAFEGTNGHHPLIGEHSLFTSQLRERFLLRFHAKSSPPR